MVKDKMIKNAAWAKVQANAIKASYVTAMSYLMANSNAFADGSSQARSIAKNIREFLFPFYVLVVGALCIMSWLKGQTAVALISLIVGLVFGVVMFYPQFVQTLLKSIAGMFSAGTGQTGAGA